MHNNWTTSAVAESTSIDHWNQLLTDNVIGLDIESDVTHGFNGHLLGTSLGNHYAYMIAAMHNQRAAHHTRSSVTSRAEEVYILIHMRDGEFHLATESTDAVLQRGDSVLLSATEAFQFSCPENTSSLVLRFDQPWLKKWIPLADDCIGQPIIGGAGWGQTLSSALWNIEPSEVIDWNNPPGDVADQVAGLLGLALNPNTVSSTGSSILKRINTILRTRFEEPSLSPADVAQEVGISKRYLHQLIANTDTTFSTLLRSLRINHSKKLLANARNQHLSVTQIAMSCGFSDAGHFTRVFKKSVGQTPSLYRREMLER